MSERRGVLLKLVAPLGREPVREDGQYVVSYDPDYHLPDGSYDGGVLVTTPDPAQATRFSSLAAYALWMSGPSCRCHHWRPDGKRTRPLTHWSILIS